MASLQTQLLSSLLLLNQNATNTTSSPTVTQTFSVPNYEANPLQPLNLNAAAQPFEPQHHPSKRAHSSPGTSDFCDSDIDPPFSPVPEPPTKKSKQSTENKFGQQVIHLESPTQNSIRSESNMKQQIKIMMADAQTQWEARKRLQNSK